MLETSLFISAPIVGANPVAASSDSPSALGTTQPGSSIDSSKQTFKMTEHAPAIAA